MFVKFTGRASCSAALRALVCSACLLSAVLADPAYAQQTVNPIPAKPRDSAYQQDSEGTIVRSSDGLCWRTGYWTKDDAVAGCDGPLAPPIGKISAPPLSAEPVPAVTTQAEPPSIPTRPASASCNFSVTLSGDQSFAFNSAALSNEAQQQLQQDVVARLAQCAGTPAIRITGHTDRLGSAQYNRQLSLRRARAVASYLRQQGIRVNLETAGAGATKASAQCDDRQSRQALLACLAPDRRVTLDVRGEVRGTPN